MSNIENESKKEGNDIEASIEGRVQFNSKLATRLACLNHGWPSIMSDTRGHNT